MAPSLTTKSGTQEKRGLAFGKYQRYHRLTPEPEAILELWYETASTLMLRGVLSHTNPAHAAILDSDPLTRRCNVRACSKTTHVCGLAVLRSCGLEVTRS